MSEQDNSTNSTTFNAHTKRGPMTPEQRSRKQQRFLKSYREMGIIKAACKAAGIDRSTYKYWKENDPEFAAQLPDAKEDANETLEIIAQEQARGLEEPMVSMGRIVYEEIPVLDDEGSPKLDKHGNAITKRGKMVMVRKQSPSVLITLLKANMPEKYKERVSNEHSGPGGGPIRIERNPLLANLSDEELEQLELLAKKAEGDSHAG